ncbi:pentapeptide repeat-containing protein [Saccharothrix sp. BKS2]|uniref:pentapeptide repeat-containing protein n=1 Tax=Saccharothrix sp. BKS2 TaxID=3064400 RepID=UPI0039E918CC
MAPGVLWRGALVVFAVLVPVLATLVLVPDWLHPPLDDEALRGVADAEKRIQLRQAQGQLQNTVRSTLLQAVAGLLVLVGAAATWRQVQVAREGQLTERFTRAIDQLGSDNADVRVGGVYALERIARNSPADRDTVRFVLGAFVRNHVPREAGARGPDDGPGERLPWLQQRLPDVQAIMQVLSRRSPSPTGGRRLVLSHVDLRSLLLDPGSVLAGSVLRHTDLSRARLSGVDLRRVDLTGADLRLANLREADLRDAVLRRAALAGANLTGADLTGTDLAGADLAGADLTGANLSGADLTGAKLTGADLRDAALERTRLTGAVSDGTTRWPADRRPPDHV